jgi:hypothetical protein
MAVLIRPKRWTEKPPANSAIDWSHPLAHGLRLVVVLSDRGGQRVENPASPEIPGFWVNGASATALQHTIGPGGTGLKSADAGASALDPHVSFGDPARLRPTDKVTILARAQFPATSAAYSRLFGANKASNASPYTPFMLAKNGGSPDSWVFDIATTTFTEQVIMTGVAGEVHTIAGSYDGVNMRGYADGVLKATTAKSGAINADAGAVLLGGNASGGLDEGWYAPIHYAMLWTGRALTPGELLWLQHEPFAMFVEVPVRRHFVKAAGGTTFFQTVTGALSPSGSLQRETRKTLAGATSPTGALARQVQKALGGSVSPAGALARQVQKVLGGSVSPAGALSRSISKTLAGAVSPAGNVLKQVAKTLTGAVSPTGALSSTKVVLITLAGALSPAGALARQAQKALGGSMSPAGALARSISKTVAGNVSPAGSLIKLITKSFAGAVSPAGTVAAAIAGALAVRTLHFLAHYAPTAELRAHFRTRAELRAHARDTVHKGGHA